MVRFKRRGLSLLEVIIAASLMLILLTAFYAIAEALKKSQVVSDSRLEARQNLRNAVKLTGFYFSQARFVYTLPNNAAPALSINGYDCLLPQREPADPEVIHAGDSLAFAVPVDQTRLGDPHLDPKNPVAAAGARLPGADGFCDNRELAEGTDPNGPENFPAPPFPEDAARYVYFGGFDANFLDAHNTAWIFRAPVETVPTVAP